MEDLYWNARRRYVTRCRALTSDLGTRRAGRLCGLPWDPSS